MPTGRSGYVGYLTIRRCQRLSAPPRRWWSSPSAVGRNCTHRAGDLYLASAARFPHDHSVPAAENHPAVEQQRHGAHIGRRLVRPECRAGRVPQPHPSVVAAAADPPPIGRCRHRCHPAGMGAEFNRGAGLGRVPPRTRPSWPPLTTRRSGSDATANTRAVVGAEFDRGRRCAVDTARCAVTGSPRTALLRACSR